MLVGAGADKYSREQGLEQVEPGWFYTEHRWESLEKTLKEKGLPIPPKPAGILLRPRRMSRTTRASGARSASSRWTRTATLRPAPRPAA